MDDLEPEMDPRTKYYTDLVSERATEFPTANKLATLSWFHLVATADLIQRHLGTFAAKLDLSLAAWGVLNLLHYAVDGARPMHEVSQLMLVSRQNVSQIVDGLEKKGLVTRIPSPTDGRVKLTRITKKGREVVLSHRHVHQEMVRSVFESLRDPELQLFSDYLLRLQNRMEELGAPDGESEVEDAEETPPRRRKSKRSPA